MATPYMAIYSPKLQKCVINYFIYFSNSYQFLILSQQDPVDNSTLN